ncbi:hypothetical protein BJ170DRAFT_234859 [Xylariales sp. AK1849]|nr:hypothetical protein BJ170DRAFT_234859 [Xylariales sp. AK1849]
MALLNPLQILIFPLVFLVALPLAICAGFTTILASLVLFLRLFMVYFDVGVETCRYALVGHGRQSRFIESPSVSRRSSRPTSPVARRSESLGTSSMLPPHGLPDVLPLTPITELVRDYEGVGGWRYRDSANAEDEHAWESLNSRLEVTDHHRHHFRSSSGGALLSGTPGLGLYTKPGSRTGPHSPITTTFSPNSLRNRTPSKTKIETSASMDREGSYFPPLTMPKLKRVAA